MSLRNETTQPKLKAAEEQPREVIRRRTRRGGIDSMADSWIIAAAILACFSLASCTYVAQVITIHGCQGRRIPMDECIARNSQMQVQSVTIYATPNTTHIGQKKCLAIQDCMRTIHSAEDIGLTPSFQHLYRWIAHKCEGKSRCDYGILPDWLKLTGEFKDGNSNRCPETGTKYFTSVQVHINCVVEGAIPTKPPPPETTPRTPPPTPPGTTSFDVYIPIYVPELIGREKIYLGVAIGLSMAILILILITIYCCERYRRKRKLGLLHRMLGAPQADHDMYDEELGKPDEAWSHLNRNPDCIAEYSGVKPDEYVTLDRRSLQHSQQHISTEASLYSTNSCSTLNRTGYHRDLWNFYGQTNLGFQDELKFAEHPMLKEPRQRSAKTSSLPREIVNYDSAENIEMERRMAVALGTPKHLLHKISNNNEEDSDSSGSDILSISSGQSITSGEISDISSERSYSDDEEHAEAAAAASSADNYSNDTRELHVIVEEHAEDELEEEDGGENQDAQQTSCKTQQCWNTGLQWRVEVKFDGIGKSSSTTKSDGDTTPNVHQLPPSHYKCEVRAFDTETVTTT